nr:protein FAM124A isoform X2 [Paramormyrops kingsleyae]
MALKSDYSRMSTASSDLLRGDLPDPYLVSVHIITDPGTAKPLQRAADAALSWVHPELRLLCVSERGPGQCRPKRAPVSSGSVAIPVLAIILFLREGPAACLYGALQFPPWHHHHTERPEGHRSPLPPAGLDLFTLGPGTPPWAVRQVHYGREVVRLAVSCRHEHFGDTVRLYSLLLHRRPAQTTEAFCFFVLYSTPDMEIQLSLKRLPRRQSPTPIEAAVLEFRVQDVGALVPLLPRPCTPISAARWQTEDYDGNKILLQVPGSARHRRRHTLVQLHSLLDDSCSALNPPPSDPEPLPLPQDTYGPPSQWSRHSHPHTPRLRNQAQSQASLQDLLPAYWEEESRRHRDPGASRMRWTGQRAPSLFSLSFTDVSLPPSSTPHFPAPTRCSFVAPPFRLNVDMLLGAVETDVDTGQTLDRWGTLDLSVVSGYSRPRPRPRPVSAPPLDPESSLLGQCYGTHASLSLIPSHPPGSISASRPASTTPPATDPVPGRTCPPLSKSQTGTPHAEEDQEFYI